MFPHSTERHGEYKDLLIIIAHKEIKDAQLAFDEAEKLKDKGVEIISLATGSRKRIANIKSQLQVISTTPTNTHSADYMSMWTIVDEVLVNICGLGQCTSCKHSHLSLYTKYLNITALAFEQGLHSSYATNGS